MCLIIERQSRASADSGSLGNNVLFIELDGYTRSGPFPFLKLPLEIRLEIYLYLLGPFHSSDDKSKATHIQIQVERFYGPFDYERYISGTYEDYVEKSCHAPTFDDEFFQTPEKRWSDKLEFEREKWVKIQLGKSHPLRSGRYTISCDPYFSERSATKDWSMIRLVRDMSHVSRQIRTEFSVAFWTRVSIICPESDFAELPNVLNNRPMVCAGFKHLSFDVSIRFCDEDELSKFFDAVTQHLVLDGLTLTLTVGDGELKDMIDGEGKFLWLQRIKLLKVAVYFDLNTYYYPDVVDDDDWEEYAERVLKEHEPTLRQRLTPNTLCGRPVGPSQRQQFENCKL
ncbi:hypothetical protein IFR05_004843 [Cadophora sp. M221]|nr:hypothetical protein IFR05_004843 [Cadophora sp. M221]